MGDLKSKFPFFVQNPQIGSIEIVEIRLFTPAVDLQMGIQKSNQIESWDNPTVSLDLSSGASTGSLQQYVITDLSEDLSGFWRIRFDQTVTQNQFNDAWLVVKYQIG